MKRFAEFPPVPNPFAPLADYSVSVGVGAAPAPKLEMSSMEAANQSLRNYIGNLERSSDYMCATILKLKEENYELQMQIKELSAKLFPTFPIDDFYNKYVKAQQQAASQKNTNPFFDQFLKMPEQVSQRQGQIVGASPSPAAPQYNENSCMRQVADTYREAVLKDTHTIFVPFQKEAK